MKIALLALLAAVSLTACQTTEEHRPGLLAEEHYMPEMVVYNGSDGQIAQIALRPTGATEWHYIGGDIIGSGEKMGLRATSSRICLWDFRIENVAGEREEYLGVDRCNQVRIIFPKDQ